MPRRRRAGDLVNEGNVMRKTWPVIAVVLLCASPLAAQQRSAPAKPVSLWATAQTAEPALASSGTTYVLLPANPSASGPAVPTNAQVTHVAVPVAQPQPAPPPATAPACGQGCARKSFDWEHFRDWLCYRSLRGCSKKGSCGCNCSVPLYVYFLRECKEGRKFDLPPCAHEKEPPHLFRSMLDHARSGCRSCGTTAAPCATEPAVSYGAAHQAAAQNH